MLSLNRKKATLSAVALVALQTIAARAALENVVLPPAPDLAAFPPAVDGWKRLADISVPAATAAQLQADRILDRIYLSQQRAIQVELFVAWFRAQQGGVQPHSPKVCLPGAGWLPVNTSVATLTTSAGVIPVNVYTVTSREKTAQILYWYQTPRRTIASEWAAKFFTVVDGIRDRRTDTAVVRIAVAGGPESVAAKEAVGFARSVYPLLRELLPQ
jgi:EpsI family protein